LILKRFKVSPTSYLPLLLGQELAPFPLIDQRTVAKASQGLFPQPFWIRLFYVLENFNSKTWTKIKLGNLFVKYICNLL